MDSIKCKCGAMFDHRTPVASAGNLETCPLCGSALKPGVRSLEVPGLDALADLRRHYLAAVRELATALAADVLAWRLQGDAAWEHAAVAVKRFHDPAVTPHAWIFGTRLALALSDRTDDALDERPSEEFDWKIPDPSSAAAAVAEHEVLWTLGELHDMESQVG